MSLLSLCHPDLLHNSNQQFQACSKVTGAFSSLHSQCSFLWAKVNKQTQIWRWRLFLRLKVKDLKQLLATTQSAEASNETYGLCSGLCQPNRTLFSLFINMTTCSSRSSCDRCYICKEKNVSLQPQIHIFIPYYQSVVIRENHCYRFCFSSLLFILSLYYKKKVCFLFLRCYKCRASCKEQLFLFTDSHCIITKWQTCLLCKRANSRCSNCWKQRSSQHGEEGCTACITVGVI